MSSAETCKFDEAWRGRCTATAGADGYCPKHSGMHCCVCKTQATHDCDRTGIQFVCGAPLCDNCEETPGGGLGYFGFGGHGHRCKSGAHPANGEDSHGG